MLKVTRCEFVHNLPCEQVSGRLTELEAENAKLREERDGWKKLCTDQEVMHVMREETLNNENDKLRELVAYMWTYDYAGHFSTLPEHMEHVDAVWQQMQLLGIEVGE